ncbi:MAG: hypothetical protein ACREMB_08925 [Candidatus Rokuibacteriota bacterium]
MKQVMAYTLAVAMMAGAPIVVAAQQTGPTVPPPSTPAQTPSSGGSSAASGASGYGAGQHGQMARIDCPQPSASGSGSSMPGSGSSRGSAGTSGGSSLSSGSGGSPSTSAGAGGAAGTSGGMASAGQQRVEGQITNLDAGEKTLEVGNVKLEWDTRSAILVDCQHAEAADLQEGARVKAAYEVRDGKNVLTVLEAERR